LKIENLQLSASKLTNVLKTTEESIQYLEKQVIEREESLLAQIENVSF
jgi:hypothetical protein